MAAPMLSRTTRRDGVAVIEVVLADGDAWGLALPTPRRYPIVIRETDRFGRPLVRIEIGTAIGYRLEIRREWEAVVTACRDGLADGESVAFRRLVASLILAAHDVDRPTAEALLDPRRVDLGRIAGVLIPAAFGSGHPSRSDER